MKSVKAGTQSVKRQVALMPPPIQPPPTHSPKPSNLPVAALVVPASLDSAPAAPAASAVSKSPASVDSKPVSGAVATQPKVLSSSQVRYVVQPVLSYPQVSRDLGESGVVRLRVLVDEQGRPKDIDVSKSSGYPRLDQHAILAMKGARFQPHLEDGVPRMGWAQTELKFSLEDQ
ncbi:MAG: energy transducer TonB [Aquabacterium sp.]|nr:energy transducer TonB [Aquabacterium sp.]